MALTWTLDFDGLQNVGSSGQLMPATAAPAPADYVTGGYVIPPITFGFGALRGLLILGVLSAVTTTAYLWQYNPTTGSLQVFESGAEDDDAAPFAEVAADTDLSSLNIRVLAYGF